MCVCVCVSHNDHTACRDGGRGIAVTKDSAVQFFGGILCTPLSGRDVGSVGHMCVSE